MAAQQRQSIFLGNGQRGAVLKRFLATADVWGRVGASVTLKQTFVNSYSSQPLEAVYQIELPQGAALCGGSSHNAHVLFAALVRSLSLFIWLLLLCWLFRVHH